MTKETGIKIKLAKESSQLYDKIVQLKLQSSDMSINKLILDDNLEISTGMEKEIKEKHFLEIVHLIKDAQNNAVMSINVEMINLYWNVGQYLNKQLSHAAWGNKVVDELANFIQQKYPEIKGFNRRGLYRMKQFFEIYSSTAFVSSVMTQFKANDIRKTILAKISWTPDKKLLQQKLRELYD